MKRLGRLISPAADGSHDMAKPLMETPYFGFVEEKQFRIWQPHTAATLADLARSVSHIATMSEPARAEMLAKVDELYAEYGRGHDGMQVPYVTQCYRAVVRHEELPVEDPPRGRRAPATTPLRPGSRTTEPTGPVTRPRRRRTPACS